MRNLFGKNREIENFMTENLHFMIKLMLMTSIIRYAINMNNSDNVTLIYGVYLSGEHIVRDLSLGY